MPYQVPGGFGTIQPNKPPSMLEMYIARKKMRQEEDTLAYEMERQRASDARANAQLDLNRRQTVLNEQTTAQNIQSKLRPEFGRALRLVAERPEMWNQIDWSQYESLGMDPSMVDGPPTEEEIQQIYATADQFDPDGAETFDDRPLPGTDPKTGESFYFNRGSRGTIKRVEGIAPPSKAAAKEPAPTMTEVVDPKDPKRMLRVDARKYQGGSLGDPGVLGVSGKEPSAALKEVEGDKGAQAFSDQIDTMRTQYQMLVDAGAITDTSKSWSDNLAAAAQTAPGSEAIQRIFGGSSQGVRDSIRSIRPTLILSIKQATGASAQMMNSNVELQQFIKAATDPDQSIQANMAALDNLEAMVNSMRAEGGAVKAAPSSDLPEGVTEEDVQHTMQIHGMTREQVLEALGAP